MTEHVDQHVDMPHADVSRETADADRLDIDNLETEGDVQSLREQLEGARQEAASNQDKFLRARADMENYKKRIERTYADLTKMTKKELLIKLLGVKDNLERALHYGESGDVSGEGLVEGVRLTQYQLEQLLSQEGVTPMDAEGRPFDPRVEEAIQRVVDTDVPDQTVVKVVRKGYTYGDEVLRPAQVIVNVHGSD